MKLSASYKLVEAIKGQPKVSGMLISEKTMDGVQFTPGLKYLVVLHGNNYVGFCGGSLRLDFYKAPFKNEEGTHLEKIRGLVRENT